MKENPMLSQPVEAPQLVVMVDADVVAQAMVVKGEAVKDVVKVVWDTGMVDVVLLLVEALEIALTALDVVDLLVEDVTMALPALEVVDLPVKCVYVATALAEVPDMIDSSFQQMMTSINPGFFP